MTISELAMALRFISVLHFLSVWNGIPELSGEGDEDQDQAKQAALQGGDWQWAGKTTSTCYCRSFVGEPASWEWSWVLLVESTNLAVVHTTCFPQILQPSFSLTSLRDVTCRNKDTHRYTEQLSWLQRGRHPGQSAAPAHSHPKNCRESNELAMEVTTPQICHLQGKGTRKSLSIP